ncbi:sugar-binding transcriptional regulator [Pseudalkalibacillus decolorationis]|uniref:sugar-binding transcriptional regulator n=1 Tax=Pseudalkalibacillus decolorationis TaxID=163879 RepID=UPI0021491876|nr:sugar-binding domain-containing protein [Pseudalkalibacillus decolorationis]
METLIDVQRKLLPDLLDVMQNRYRILQNVRYLQPVGRRSLSVNLQQTERVLRAEVEFLNQQGLLKISPQGMTMTDEGNHVLLELEEVMKQVSGLHVLEQQLMEKLNLEDVIIVPGDSDRDSWVQRDMGKACITRLMPLLKAKRKIAVTGGTTIAAVAEMMTPMTKKNQPLFVPARGGLGENVENQANTICSTMARKASGEYRLLHVPDQLSEESYQMMVEEPGVKEVLDLIRSAEIVIHGIGEAETMAVRRKSSTEVLEKVQANHAVAEAFGYYFDQIGNVVHKVKTVGLQLDDLTEEKTIFAVAGGSSKANAIAAYMKRGPRQVLITDEGAAKSLI